MDGRDRDRAWHYTNLTLPARLFMTSSKQSVSTFIFYFNSPERLHFVLLWLVISYQTFNKQNSIGAGTSDLIITIYVVNYLQWNIFKLSNIIDIIKNKNVKDPSPLLELWRNTRGTDVVRAMNLQFPRILVKANILEHWTNVNQSGDSCF